jgi:hypothetical protein
LFAVRRGMRDYYHLLPRPIFNFDFSKKVEKDN